jgi:hypothetical protein
MAWYPLPLGRAHVLAGCVLATLFILTGVSGDNLFARHVGMTASSATATPVAARDSAPATAPADVVGIDTDGVPTGSSQNSGDAAHLLHLLSACLTVLAGVSLLLQRCRRCPAAAPARHALSRLLVTAHWVASARGSPPPLSPPRASPVIRT